MYATDKAPAPALLPIADEIFTVQSGSFDVKSFIFSIYHCEDTGLLACKTI